MATLFRMSNKLLCNDKTYLKGVNKTKVKQNCVPIKVIKKFKW